MLTNLKIRNFKSILEGDFSLGRLNLFTGINAVGKSSAIQPLLLLQQSLRNGDFERGLFLKDDDLLSLGLGKDVFSIGAPAEALLTFELEWDYTHTLEVSFHQAAEKDVLPLAKRERSEDFDLGAAFMFSDNTHYLGANRINPQTQYKTSTYHVDNLVSLGKEGEYTVHYLARHQNRPLPNPDLQHPDAKSDTLLDNVSAWLSEISPGVKVNATYHEKLEVASLSYSFELQNGYTESFKPTNVGFGLTYVLPIITALLMMPPGGLLIIENPESHLHPAGQARIARLCALAAASGTQIMLESHSDHILNGIRVAIKQGVLSHEDTKVYYFQREAESPDHSSRVIPIHIDATGRADEWPDGFFDEWDKQLDLLLE
ncbi:MAG: DUF3696 domain-containing protein [Bacteroidia bacterium]